MCRDSGSDQYEYQNGGDGLQGGDEQLAQQGNVAGDRRGEQRQQHPRNDPHHDLGYEPPL